MSGLVGVISFKGPPLTKEDIHLLKKMGERLRFRAPFEDNIVQFDTKAAFLFRRLSAEKRLLKKEADQTFHLMVNGETHNPNNQSNLESILPLYLQKGLDFVKELIGMYAISLWDSKKSQLILARDPLGIKPLFYAITSKGHLIYGSEIKALLAHPDCPREVDWLASLVRPYFYENLDRPFSSGFKGINRVDPGSILLCDNFRGVLEKHQWWQLKRHDNNDDKREKKEVIEGYFNLLRDSVQRQLTPGKEVALSLSGGIDSVSVAALAREVAPLQTFTIHNYTGLVNEDVRYAHEASTYLKIPNHQLFFPWQENSIDYDTFKEVVWASEMPVNAEHIFKHILYKKIKENFPSIDTLLMGQGSDDFNGGYTDNWIEKINLDLEENNWEAFIKSIQETEKKGRLLAINPNLQSYLGYLSKNFASIGSKDPMLYYHLFHINQVEGYNLWHEDRNSSINGLENQVPFLDHRIVEYLANIPKELQKDLFFRKEILREAMEPLLPEQFRYRPKGNCFAGKAVRYSDRTLYHILADNDFYGLKDSILDNPYADGIIDKDTLLKQFKKIPESPSYEGIEQILFIASLGLLARWAGDRSEPEHKSHLNPKIDWVNINDWSQDKHVLAIKMATVKQELTELTTMVFEEGVLFLINPVDNSGFFSLREKLEYILDPKEKRVYIEFLKKIDGKKNIASILAELKAQFVDVRADLEEAMEYRLLVIKN